MSGSCSKYVPGDVSLPLGPFHQIEPSHTIREYAALLIINVCVCVCVCVHASVHMTVQYVCECLFMLVCASEHACMYIHTFICSTGPYGYRKCVRKEAWHDIIGEALCDTDIGFRGCVCASGSAFFFFLMPALNQRANVWRRSYNPPPVGASLPTQYPPLKYNRNPRL